MKKIVSAILCVLALAASTSAQGLINFVNSSAFLVSISTNFGTTPMPGTLGQFQFELFIAPAGTLDPGQFVTTNVRGTNLATAGRFVGGNNIAVNGVPLGGTAAILVRGWSSNLGDDYASAFSRWSDYWHYSGYLGESLIAPQFLFGGDGGSGPVPASPAFGGSNGIQSGFTLVYLIPEPSVFALIGSSTAMLVLVRRRERHN